MKKKYKDLFILVMLIVSSVIYGQVKAASFLLEKPATYIQVTLEQAISQGTSQSPY